jgi:hypothetical protein
VRHDLRRGRGRIRAAYGAAQESNPASPAAGQSRTRPSHDATLDSSAGRAIVALMHIESAAALAVAAALLACVSLSDRRKRVLVALAALGVLLVLMLRLSLHLSVPMGDYANFIESRHNFNRYFGDQVNFQFHLGGVIVRGFDAAFGADARSAIAAFDALARLAAVTFVVALGLFALYLRWSAQVLRYVGLAVAVPTTLLFFGYHEFGHLPAALDVVAVPLALVGLAERSRSQLLVAGFLAGVGSALHGFGLIALSFIVLLTGAALWRDRQARGALGRATPAAVAAAGLLGWLIWLAIYLIGASWSIDPGHSDVRPLRPFLHAHYVEHAHRIAQPILSGSGIGEIGWELAVTGAPLVLIAAWFRRSPAVVPVLVATVPILLYLAWFWPVQGLGNDSDFLGSAFPPTYAAAWIIASDAKASALGFLTLIAGSAAISHVLTWPFVHSPIPH